MSKDEKSTYYDAGGIETLDIIKAKLTPEQFEGYLLGNGMKYALRMMHKTPEAPLRDAEKAANYFRWLHANIKEGKVMNAKINKAVNDALGAIEVSCCFPNSAKEYSYRTVIKNLAVGDLAVAQTGEKCSVVKVVKVLGEISLETEEQMIKFNYDSLSWIVQKLDVDSHLELLRIEKQLKDALLANK